MSQIIKRTFRFLNSTRFGVYILFTCLVCLWSCNIKEEGCLDIAAENFDLSADKDCDGCCTYPSVLVSLSQKWNDVNFKQDDSVTYSDIHGEQYRIIDLRYLLSSFSWLDENNAFYTVDSSEIECGEDMLGYTQDLIIVEPRKFVYTLDTIRLSPSVRNLNFKIGWKPEFECVDETDETLPAVFSNASTLWDTATASRAAIRIILQRDLETQSFDTVYIQTCQNMQIGYIDEIIPGKDFQFNVSVNYAQWFQDADIDDLNSFTTSVLGNMAGSFTRTP